MRKHYWINNQSEKNKIPNNRLEENLRTLIRTVYNRFEKNPGVYGFLILSHRCLILTNEYVVCVQPYRHPRRHLTFWFSKLYAVWKQTKRKKFHLFRVIGMIVPLGSQRFCEHWVWPISDHHRFKLCTHHSLVKFMNRNSRDMFSYKQCKINRSEHIR